MPLQSVGGSKLHLGVFGCTKIFKLAGIFSKVPRSARFVATIIFGLYSQGMIALNVGVCMSAAAHQEAEAHS